MNHIHSHIRKGILGQIRDYIQIVLEWDDGGDARWAVGCCKTMVHVSYFMNVGAILTKHVAT